MTDLPRYGPDWLHGKIAADRCVVIDGAMGTELEARGVPMDDAVWSGAALLTHPDIVRAAHADYIRAGAEVIITNTFGAGRQALASAGCAGEMARINRSAVAVALEAREEAADRPVAIGGSIYAEVFPDGTKPAMNRLADEYREQAELLAGAGVDLLVLEMCSDPLRSRMLAEVAVATGLPVWAGVSCKRKPDTGRLVGFEAQDSPFEELVCAVGTAGVGVINVMHSAIPDTTAALSVVRDHWSGPVGAYPESGYFRSPNWQFVDIIDPDDLVDEARVWVNDGARIIGGCCGLSVRHIRALKAAFA